MNTWVTLVWETEAGNLKIFSRKTFESIVILSWRKKPMNWPLTAHKSLCLAYKDKNDKSPDFHLFTVWVRADNFKWEWREKRSVQAHRLLADTAGTLLPNTTLPTAGSLRYCVCMYCSFLVQAEDILTENWGPKRKLRTQVDTFTKCSSHV